MVGGGCTSLLSWDGTEEEEGWEHVHFSRNMLKRRGEEKGSISGLPITQDQAQRIEEPQSTTPTLDEVKQAQRISGELMWLLTRSRPDLMYVMSKMCQSTLKNPREVVEVGAQVIKYLRKTHAQGVCLTKEKGGLEVYTDSSFGPGGNDSQGTVIVMWARVMVMWKSGKQPLAPLSTAESELQESIEGMTMGDSCDVLIMEVEKESRRGQVMMRTRKRRSRSTHQKN